MMEINVVVRPKQNAGVPARFFSRIYAVYDDALLNIYNHIKTRRVDDNELCLSRFIDMKKTAKKTE